MAIDLTGYAEAIGAAMAEASFCILASQGSDGIPDIGFKGSMVVFDRDHLAYWERTRGKQLENVRAGGGVAVMYFNRQRGMYLRAFGRAEIFESGPVRDKIMAGTPAFELERDPERKGAGVLIRVDQLEEAFGGVSQRREAADAAG